MTRWLEPGAKSTLWQRNAPSRAATLLASGALLVAGGGGGAGYLASAEVYNPTVFISPATVSVPPKASQVFTASGGSATGYAWAFVTNASGGTLTSTGVYTAGATGGVTDLVGVTDSLGNSTHAAVTVTMALTISPAAVSLVPKASQTFTASGGSGTGYTWALATNGSGATVSSTGLYTAGSLGGVSDVVQVTDSLGASAKATVTVNVATTALAVSPSSVTVAPGSSQTFTVSGGSGTGYIWVLTTNASGGTISGNGVYTAGATGSVTDVARVTDSLGATATATIAVTAKTSSPPTTASGGCSSTGGSLFSLLGLAGLPLLVARRRRLGHGTGA